MDEKRAKVLAYDAGDSGWTDDLTAFHEDNAGDDHYIDKASRAHALSVLERALRMPNPVIMDIGCSSGYMLRMLKERFPGGTVIGASDSRGMEPASDPVKPEDLAAMRLRDRG